MVQFLNTQTAYSEIESIINRAESSLVLISPYIQISKPLLQRLFLASENRGIDITLVCRKNEIKPDAYNALNQISRLEIYDLPNLNVRCFYNEKSMVITSLNLYDYSWANNREMGVLITYDKEPGTFLGAVNEAEYMIQLATLVKANMVIAKATRQPVPAGDISFFDIQGGIKKSFPTFSKILTHTRV